MTAPQPANTWSDLRNLLDAGVSVESALGLEEDSQGPPRPFKENLTVDVIGDQNEVFEFHLPDASEIEMLGLPESNEGLSVLPPFIDLSNLLQPLYIKGPKSSDCVVVADGAIVDVNNKPSVFDEPQCTGSFKQEQSMDFEVCTTSKGTKRKRQPPGQTGGNSLSKTKHSREQSSSTELLQSSNDNQFVDLTGPD